MKTSSPVRVIPKLDLKGPNLVKGLQFEGNRCLGTGEEFADKYYADGADELFYQDVVASLYGRNSLLEIIKSTAKKLFVPLTVAGGIRTIDDIRSVLLAGGDKVAINSAAVERPGFLSEAARIFGSQCIVLSIETYFYQGCHQVWTDYGREVSKYSAAEWAAIGVDNGVGEIILTSINNDGMGRGYDLEIINEIANNVPVPVIAAGGAGKLEDFSKVVLEAGADAVCAASVFHYNYARPIDRHHMSYDQSRLRMGEHIDSGNIEFLNIGYGGQREIMVQPCTIGDVKRHLSQNSIPVRSALQQENSKSDARSGVSV